MPDTLKSPHTKPLGALTTALKGLFLRSSYLSYVKMRKAVQTAGLVGNQEFNFGHPAFKMPHGHPRGDIKGQVTEGLMDKKI